MKKEINKYKPAKSGGEDQFVEFLPCLFLGVGKGGAKSLTECRKSVYEAVNARAGQLCLIC